jgi:hypothetical protein
MKHKELIIMSFEEKKIRKLCDILNGDAKL